MGRKTTWKEIHLTNSESYKNLKSCMIGFPDLKRYTIDIQEGAGVIETNLSWLLLRDWFSFASVVLPVGKILVADQPSWESNQDE